MTEGPELVRAAALAAGGQQYPSPALFVVATPIGNLAELTFRALHVLALVDAVACEDTRHSATLLRRFGLVKPLLAVHAHNELAASAAVIARLERGERVAYVSDAGTPAISDPGAVLVREVGSAGHRVVPIAGPSSAVAAMSVAGDVAAQGFVFAGFLPAKGAARAARLAALAATDAAFVVFEAPHRIESLAESLAERCADRRATLCRELTKQFETVVTLMASDLPAWLAGDPHRTQGEFVVVVHARVATTADDADDSALDALLRPLLDELPLKQATALAARIGGAPRNAVYARALALRALDGTAAPGADRDS